MQYASGKSRISNRIQGVILDEVRKWEKQNSERNSNEYMFFRERERVMS